MRISAPRVAAAFAVALVVGTAACAQTQSQPTAEAALCDSLTTFGNSLRTFADLDPATSSMEDVRTARATIAASWDQVVADAGGVAEADRDAVESAWNDFSQAIDELPSDEPISDALATLEPARDNVQAAYQEMSDGVGCGPGASG